MSNDFEFDVSSMDELRKRRERRIAGERAAKTKVQAFTDTAQAQQAEIASIPSFLVSEGDGVRPFAPQDSQAQDVLKQREKERTIDNFHAEFRNRALSEWLFKDNNGEFAHDAIPELEAVAKVQDDYKLPDTFDIASFKTREEMSDTGDPISLGDMADGAKYAYAGGGRYVGDLVDRAEMGFVMRRLHQISSGEVLNMSLGISGPDQFELADRDFYRAEIQRLKEDSSEFDYGLGWLGLVVAEQFGNLIIPLFKRVAAEATVQGSAKAMAALAGKTALRKSAPAVEIGIRVRKFFEGPVRRAAGYATVYYDTWQQEMGAFAEESWQLLPGTDDFPRDDPRRLMSIMTFSAIAAGGEALGQMWSTKPYYRGMNMNSAVRAQFRRALTDRSMVGHGKAIGWAALGEGTTELGQEGLAILMMTWQQVISDSQTLEEALEKMTSEENQKRLWNAFITGAAVGGVYHGAGIAFEKGVYKIESTEVVKGLLGSFGKQASTFERMENSSRNEAFLGELEDVVEQLRKKSMTDAQIAAALDASGNTEGSIDEVLVDAVALGALFQEGEIDIDEFFNALPEGEVRDRAREQYKQGQDTGGDVAIPLGAYGVHILKTEELHGKLKQHIRMRHDDYTQAEVADAMLGVKREAEAASARAERIVKEATQREKDTVAITDIVYKQLVEAQPQHSKRVSKDQARVLASIVVNIAERSGRTVEEVRNVVGPLLIKKYSGQPDIKAENVSITREDLESQFLSAEGDVIPRVTERLAANERVFMVPIAELVPFRTDDRRVDPKSEDAMDVPTEEQLRDLTAAFKRGDPIESPIVLGVSSDGLARIEDGNTRLAAMEDAGFTHIPVVMARANLGSFGKRTARQPTSEVYTGEAGVTAADFGFTALDRNADSEVLSTQPEVSGNAEQRQAEQARQESRLRRHTGILRIRGSLREATTGQPSGSETGPYTRGTEVGSGGARVLDRGVSAIEHAPSPEVSAALAELGLIAPVMLELQGDNKGEVFRDAIARVSAANAFGAAVDVKTAEEYATMDLFLTEDGEAGAAQNGDDMVSLFTGPGPTSKGASIAMQLLRIQRGARRLDAFDTTLPSLYSMLGFRVVSRLKWDESQKPDGWDKQVFAKWNNGEPDIVFMVYDPNHFAGYAGQTEGQLVDTWEEAAAIQAEAVVTIGVGTKVSLFQPQQGRIRAFHATTTPEGIDEFRPLTHFGTPKAANDRLRQLELTGDRSVEGRAPRIAVVDLDIRNPLRVRDNTVFSLSDPEVLAQAAQEQGAITGAEKAAISEPKEGFTREIVQDADKIIALLESKGYDGIVYRNQAEDSGSQSYMIFRPEQAKSAISKGGLFQQFADYLGQIDENTANWKNYWKKSKAVDINGDPVMLYIGTNWIFDAFDVARGNIESDQGQAIYSTNDAYDASGNYTGMGADLTNRILQMTDDLVDASIDASGFPTISWADAEAQAKRELMGPTEGLVLQVVMSLQNPVILGNRNGFEQETVLAMKISYDKDGNAGPFGGVLAEIIEELIDAEGAYEDLDANIVVRHLLAEIMQDGANDEGEFTITARRLRNFLMEEDEFMFATQPGDHPGAYMGPEIIRRLFQAVGFDGIIDHRVDFKWGTQSGRNLAMIGMDANTTHYIAFRDTQVKSTLNRGTWSTSDPDIMKQDDEEYGPAGMSRAEREDFYDERVAGPQRGRPEHAMLQAQFALGGGVLSYSLEHGGDLIHRMSEKVTARSGGYIYVQEKVRNLIRTLDHPYGFERESRENAVANADFRETPRDEYNAKVEERLADYTDAHRALPVYNEVQKLARLVATSIGGGYFNTAREALHKLQEYLDEGETAWAARTHEAFPQPGAHIMFSSDGHDWNDTFYSKFERAMNDDSAVFDQSKQWKGPELWKHLKHLATRKKKGNPFKLDDLNWSNLEWFLTKEFANNPNRIFTTEEVLDAVANGVVKVKTETFNEQTDADEGGAANPEGLPEIDQSDWFGPEVDEVAFQDVLTDQRDYIEENIEDFETAWVFEDDGTTPKLDEDGKHEFSQDVVNTIAEEYAESERDEGNIRQSSESSIANWYIISENGEWSLDYDGTTIDMERWVSDWSDAEVFANQFLVNEGELFDPDFSENEGNEDYRGYEAGDDSDFAQWTLSGPSEQYSRTVMSVPNMLRRVPIDTTGWTAEVAGLETNEVGNRIWKVLDELGYEKKSLFAPDAIAAIGQAADGISRQRAAREYVGGHYDKIENYIVHFRWSIRRTLGGRKIFFIEEIQSNWQADIESVGGEGSPLSAKQLDKLAKTRGFKWQLNPLVDPSVGLGPQEARKFDKGLMDIANQINARGGPLEGGPRARQLQRQATPVPPFNAILWNPTAGASGKAITATPTGDGMYLVNNNPSYDQPPPAPFQNTFVLLAFKQALKMAVQEGADEIGWSTGEQNAEYYSITKVINKISMRPELRPASQLNFAYQDDSAMREGELYSFLQLHELRGDTQDMVINRDGVIVAAVLSRYVDQPLSAIVGKEVAAEVLGEQDSGGKYNRVGLEVMSREGDHLKLGQDGMKKFYDDRVVWNVKQYVKQWKDQRGDSAVVASSKVQSGVLQDTYVGPRVSQDQMHIMIDVYANNKLKTLLDVAALNDQLAGPYNVDENGSISVEFNDEAGTDIVVDVSDEVTRLHSVADVMYGELKLGVIDRSLGRAPTWEELMAEFGKQNPTTGAFGLADIIGGRVDFKPKPHTIHSVRLNDNMRQSARNGQVLHQPTDGDGPVRKPPRGYYKAGRNQGDQNEIGLGDGANLSTFLHEAVGHYAFHILGKMSQMPDADPQLVKDYRALLKFAGVADGQPVVNQEELQAALERYRVAEWEGNEVGMADAERAINHANRHLEKIARAAEQYLGSGVAPSTELRGVFERMQQWFLELYETISRSLTDQTGGELPQDVIDAFDRLIASDAAIAKAKADYGLESVFPTKPDFMTDGEWHEHEEGVRAHEAQARSLFMQRQQKEEARLKKKRRKDDEAEMGVRVERELRQDKVQQARHWLGTGVWIGENDGPDSPHLKLDRAELIKEFGSRVVRELPGGRDGVLAGAKAGGMPHWEVAKMFDMTGPELVEAMKGAKLLDAAVREEVTNQLEEEEMTVDELTDTALEALHEAGTKVVVDDMAWASKQRDEAAREDAAATEVATGPAGSAQSRKADVDASKAALDAAQKTLSEAQEEGSADAVLEAGRVVAEANSAWEDAVLLRRAALPARRGERAAAQKVGNLKLLQKALQAQAEADVRKRRLGDMKPDRHSSAERAAIQRGKKAVAAKDWVGVLEAEADQLYHHYAFRATLKALDRKRTVQNRVRRLTKPKHLAKVEVGGAEISKHMLVLATLSKLIGGSRALPETDQDIEAFSNKMAEEDGVNFAFDASWISNILKRIAVNDKGWRDLSLEELNELDLAIVNLDHIGFEGNKVFVNNKRMLIDDFVTLMDEHSRRVHNMPLQDAEIDPNAPPVPFTARGFDLFKDNARYLHTFFVKIESFAKYLDGVEGGPAWQFFGKMARSAQHMEHLLKGDWGQDMTEIFSVYSRGEMRKMSKDAFHVPETGRSFTLEEVFMIALHSGNKYNREAMMNGWISVDPFRQPWTEPQLQAVLKILDQDPRYVDTVNRIWAMIEKRWPMIQAHEKAITGRAPEQVKSEPYRLDSGTILDGGYMPLKKDPKYSTKADIEQEQNLRKQQFGGASVHNQTNHGFTSGRKNFGNNIPLISFSALYEHMNEVAHDTAQRKFVIDALKIIRHKKFERLIEDYAGREMLTTLRQWVRNIAGDSIIPSDPYTSWIKQARIGANSSIIGLSFTTPAVQFLSLANSMVKVGPVPVFRAMGAFIMEPGKMLEYALENSEEVPHRRKVRDREVADVASRLTADAGLRADAIEFGYRMVAYTDTLVAGISWTSFVSYGMNELGMNEQAAMEYADSLIPQTQGSGAPKDLTRLQANPNEFVKQATVFYTYWASVFDLFENTIRDVYSGKLTKLQFTSIMFWWMIITPAIGEIILGRAPDFADLFDRENHEWLKFFGWNTVGNAASMIPLGSQIQRAALDKRQGVSIGTGSRVLEEFAYGLGGIGQAIGGEPVAGTAAAIEHLGKAAWMYYGLPGLVQSERLVKTAVLVSGGHDVSVRQPLFGRNK